MIDRSRLVRTRTPHEHGKVAFIELFFDLVFVFAVTQLSHTLIEHFTPEGALQTAMLLMAIWWVWIYTSWFTNWLDPETLPVRLLMLALTLAGLIVSASLPQAFGGRGLAFAGAYVAMQLLRTAFALWVFRGSDPGQARNFTRILAWLSGAGAFWIAGGLAEGGTRMALWAVALGVEVAGPPSGYWVPGLGRSVTGDWKVEGGHFAERCGLFIIIALGESVLVTGATFAGLAWTPATVATFIAAATGSLAMWWLYFDTSAARASTLIASSNDPGRLARLAYTYMHIVLVAGIVLSAAGDGAPAGARVRRDGDRRTGRAGAFPGGRGALSLGHLRRGAGRAPRRGRGAGPAGVRRGVAAAGGAHCRGHGGADRRGRLGEVLCPPARQPRGRGAGAVAGCGASIENSGSSSI
jgi:low temperature requirement protein LtrA